MRKFGLFLGVGVLAFASCASAGVAKVVGGLGVCAVEGAAKSGAKVAKLSARGARKAGHVAKKVLW